MSVQFLYPFLFIYFQTFKKKNFNKKSILYWGIADLAMCGSFMWAGIYTHVSILSQIHLPSRLAYNIEQSSMCLCPFLNKIFDFCYWVLEFVIYFWLFSSVQSLSRVRLFATPWIVARQASLSITKSQSLLRLMPIESVMPSSHLILYRPLLLLPPVPPSIRVFSNESTLRIRWPKYCSFTFSISPSNEHPGLISFRMDWLDFLGVQGTLKSSPTPQFKSINFSVLSFLHSPTLTATHPLHMAIQFSNTIFWRNYLFLVEYSWLSCY